MVVGWVFMAALKWVGITLGAFVGAILSALVFGTCMSLALGSTGYPVTGIITFVIFIVSGIVIWLKLGKLVDVEGERAVRDDSDDDPSSS